MSPGDELLGAELRRLRERRGLSLRELSAQLEPRISPQQLSRLERGERSPSLAALHALAVFYEARFVVDCDGVRLDRLLLLALAG